MNDKITFIYKQHVKTVYRITLMMLKSVPDAEDAVQSVFINLMTADKDFESDEHIKAWLIVTAQNVCKNMLKSSWNSRRDDYDRIEEQPYLPEESTKEIWNSITSLDEKYRLPLYLYYYEGYKTEEIAKMLKTNHATVRTRLKTARNKLKRLLEEMEEQII